MAISVPKAPSPFSTELRQHLHNSPWPGKSVVPREMDGRHLLGAAGAARANQNNAEIVKMAVPVLGMLLLLLTAAAVSMTADDRACLRAFFRSHMFLMFCVLLNTTSGCALAWMAVTAPTQAARRSYAESTVASFVLLAVNLHSALSNLPDVDDAA